MTTDFEKQLFGEEETKEKAKAKNEEDFLREFEEELLKEDIPEYTESLNQKKQEEKATQIDASLDDLLDNIPQDDFSTGDAAKEEEMQKYAVQNWINGSITVTE